MSQIDNCTTPNYFYIHAQSDADIQTVSTLQSKDARQKWEVIFNQHYIQPVLNNLDDNLADAMDFIAKDDQQGEYMPHA